MEFNFMLQIFAEIDEKTNEVKVKKVIPINVASGKCEKITHVINKTEAKYGILTLGKNARQIGMPIGTEIDIYVDGRKSLERVMTHKSIFGRIDGLTKAYSDEEKDGMLREGDEIEASYVMKEGERPALEITKIRGK